MKITLNRTTLLVEHEPGDKRFKDESHLLYHIKLALNKQGFDLIKKQMWRDGQLVDTYQQYLRPRGGKQGLVVYSGRNQIVDAGQEYNRDGKFTFLTTHYLEV